MGIEENKSENEDKYLDILNENSTHEIIIKEENLESNDFESKEIKIEDFSQSSFNQVRQ